MKTGKGVADNLENLGAPVEQLASAPMKIRPARGHFVIVPLSWIERLANTRSATTYRLALFLLYLNWKEKGKPIKLANGKLRMGGVSRQSKWRALRELESRGLITVERRPKRSPLIRLCSV
jgi:hypothetical protein